MFGYVLPSKKQLTDEQWQAYRTAYCGLCHQLKQRYGFLAQFLLNYDFTFLSLLLRREDRPPETQCLRCVSSPIQGRTVCEREQVNEAATDISVLLVYWKLKDQVADEPLLKKIPALLMLCLFRRVFRKGRQNAAELDRSIETHLSALSQLERERCTSIDRTSDQFARLLADVLPEDLSEAEGRVLEQILYHLGRWIYLVDAWDDLKEDLRKKRYNPVAYRFGLSLNDLDGDSYDRAKTDLERTLIHSENLAISAYHLISFGYYSPLVENILCGGLPMVRQLVLSGEWKKRHKITKQELKRI